MNTHYRLIALSISALCALPIYAHERMSYAQLKERMKCVQQVCDTFDTKLVIQPQSQPAVANASLDPFDDFFGDVHEPVKPAVAQSQDPFADFFDAPAAPARAQPAPAATVPEDPFDDFFGEAPARTAVAAPADLGIYLTFKLTEPTTSETRSALLTLACAFEDNFTQAPVPVGSLVRAHPVEPDCYYVGPLTHPDAERLLALEQGLQLIAPVGNKPSIYFWVTAARQPSVPQQIGQRTLGREQRRALGENPATHLLHYVTRNYCWRTNMTYTRGSIMRFRTLELMYMPGVLRDYIKRLFA
jgi:hypothetical protein